MTIKGEISNSIELGNWPSLYIGKGEGITIHAIYSDRPRAQTQIEVRVTLDGTPQVFVSTDPKVVQLLSDDSWEPLND